MDRSSHEHWSPGNWYDRKTVAAVEATSEPDEHVGAPLPSRITQWSRRTALGAVMSGMALGLQEVFEPREQAPIVVEVDDDGIPHDLPVELFLNPDDPRGSLALVHRSHARPPQV